MITTILDVLDGQQQCIEPVRQIGVREGDDVATRCSHSGAQRRAFVAWAEKVTARLEVRRAAPGVFAAFDDDVDRFRLLLADGTFDPAKPVVVSFRGKEVRATPKRDASAAIRDPGAA